MTQGMNRKEIFWLRALALGAINALAMIYDSQWLYAAIAADFAVLGYSLTQIDKVKEAVTGVKEKTTT